MKKFILSLISVVVLTCCTNSNTTSNYSSTDKWYVGGTLHKATIAEWKKATYENKLATCADFMAHEDNTVSMDELKRKSINMVNCIDEATRGLDNTNSMSVAEVAAACSITLGYHK